VPAETTTSRSADNVPNAYTGLGCLVLAEHLRDHQVVATRPSPTSRRSLLIPLVAAFAILVGLAIARFSTSDNSPGSGWVRVGSIQDVHSQGVVLLPEVPAYVVVDPPRTPIALLARSTHLGERVTYCRSSGWFEDPAHGTKFDRLGNYELGPAPRGLDRLATLVQDGVVLVNPNEVTLGPPRGSQDIKPTGPFCNT
jgi:hypothetical protein